MRRQAATVVVIGLVICLALLFYKRLDWRLANTMAALKQTNDISEKDKILESITVFKGMEVAVGIWLLATVGLLTGWIIHFGRQRYRSRLGRTPIERLVLHQTPFQFSILTLLALMLAVGMVFATIKILFLAPNL